MPHNPSLKASLSEGCNRRAVGDCFKSPNIFTQQGWNCPLFQASYEEMWQKFLEAPALTKSRIRLAYGVAVITDVLQFGLGPLGWAFADEALDIIAMAATWRILGFHPLLLPTFALEFLPVSDMLPTWTGCVALVVAARKRQPTVIPDPPDQGQVIDGKATRVE
jgi:hypothetical protein